jgi:ribose 5-phosphate isomerase B
MPDWLPRLYQMVRVSAVSFVVDPVLGVSIVANKVRRVRAALVFTPEQAKLSRQHNDANVLCLAGRSLNESELGDVLKTWMTTEFEGGRHERRVQKIEASRQGEQGMF